jgi:hypothetical protein
VGLCRKINGGLTVGGQTFRSKREPRSRRAYNKDRMGERSRAHAFIVPCELTGVNAMKAEVTACLVLVPCFVRPPGSRKAPLSHPGVPNALP